jgi:hypothetical protein
VCDRSHVLVASILELELYAHLQVQPQQQPSLVAGCFSPTYCLPGWTLTPLLFNGTNRLITNGCERHYHKLGLPGGALPSTVARMTSRTYCSSYPCLAADY